jgi:lysozyme
MYFVLRYPIVFCMLLAALLAAGPLSAQPVADATASATSAAALGLQPLTDDLSRQDLFEGVRPRLGVPHGDSRNEVFNLYGLFRFPTDAEYDAIEKKMRANSVFGIDISHHTHPDFPIEKLAVRKVRFLYMKATQGSGFLDPMFAQFWARAGKQLPSGRIHRGAYHFLSSGNPAVAAKKSGEDQATTFIKVIKANGGILPTDMPPVVDLEWDKAGKNAPDRWLERKPDEIIVMLTAFLDKVERELGRRPMIYTARQWWRDCAIAESKFAPLKRYPLWIADYSASSRAAENPPLIAGTPWSLWQYTENARMAIGFDAGFDANIFKGSDTQFYQTFGVARFDDGQ